MNRPQHILFILVIALSPFGLAAGQEAADSAEPGPTPAEPQEGQRSPEAQELLGRLTAALKDLEENGESFEKLERIGDMYLEAGDAQRALLVFEKAINDYGGTEDLFLKFSRVLLLSRRPELAVETLKIGIEAFPESARLLGELGQMYVQQGKYYAAVANLKKAIELDPGQRMYRYSLADAYRQQKKWDEASAIVDALIEEGWDYVPVFLMKGDLLLAEGDERRAVRYLENVQEDYPESADAKRVLVHAYQLYAYTEGQAGRLSRAIDSLRDALAIDPGNPESRSTLATFLHEAGEFEEAEAEFKKAIAETPDFLEVYMMYGKLLKFLDRNQEAREVYQAGLAKAREAGVQGAVDAYRNLLQR